MLPGDWLAAVILLVVLGALVFGHLRARHRALRSRPASELRLGHPARIQRATADARIREQVRGFR